MFLNRREPTCAGPFGFLNREKFANSFHGLRRCRRDIIHSWGFRAFMSNCGTFENILCFLDFLIRVYFIKRQQTLNLH